MNEVAAVVINRNTREFLRDCLVSIEGQDCDGGISVWVVDNGSSDGSPGMVIDDFSNVRLIWNRGNSGYARACNQGIHYTDEPFVIILNSDTVIAPDAVSRVIDCFHRNPRAGVVGPRLLNTDGSIQYSCREFPSISEAFMHGFLGLFNPDNPYSSRYKKAEWDHDRESEVDWVSGAFIAFRRRALEDIGGFDEGYFMYVEDVDVCWRMWQAGWAVRYVPDGEVIHHVGQSSRLVSTSMLMHHHSSMLRYHWKTYSGALKVPVFIFVAGGVATRFLMITAINALNRLRGIVTGFTGRDSGGSG